MNTHTIAAFVLACLAWLGVAAWVLRRSEDVDGALAELGDDEPTVDEMLDSFDNARECDDCRRALIQFLDFQMWQLEVSE